MAQQHGSPRLQGVKDSIYPPVGELSDGDRVADVNVNAAKIVAKDGPCL